MNKILFAWKPEKRRPEFIWHETQSRTSMAQKIENCMFLYFSLNYNKWFIEWWDTYYDVERWVLISRLCPKNCVHDENFVALLIATNFKSPTSLSPSKRLSIIKLSQSGHRGAMISCTPFYREDKPVAVKMVGKRHLILK